jgi:pyruvate,water dikinase
MVATTTATIHQVHWIDSAPDLPSLGGKARRLVRLCAEGLPIPPGFVLAADAFEALPAQPVEIPALPAEIVAALEQAYAALGEYLDQPEPLVAVRSSGLDEDLAQASFAGQYVTVLGVRGLPALEDAVARCWASLWSPGVAAYRAALQQRIGAELPAPGMAVLVQALVPAVAAGVAETTVGQNAAEDNIVVSGSWGLGRAVVDGLVEPDTWRIAREPLAVRELKIGEKRLQFRPQSEAPQAPVADGLRRTPCLTTDQAVAVAALALRAEAVVGCPTDIEWAFDGEDLWLLQARPLTGVNPASTEPEAQATAAAGAEASFPFAWPDPKLASVHWHRDADDGRHFGVLQPFERDARQAFTRGMAQADRLSGVATLNSCLEANGYLYYGSAPSPDDERERSRRKADHLRPIRALHERGETFLNAVILPEVRAETERLAAIDLRALDAPALADQFEATLLWYEQAWALHFTGEPWDETSPIGRAAAIYREATGDESPWAVYMAFAHAPQREHDAVAGLIELARLAQKSPELMTLLASASADAALRELEALPGAAAFRQRLAALLAEFPLHCGASQGVMAGQVLPGWADDPVTVIRLVQRYLPQDLGALTAAYDAARAQYPHDVAALGERVAATGTAEQQAQFAHWFAAAERQALAGLNHNHYIDSPVNALLHRMLMACGRRLAGHGALGEAADVWWLHAHEIAAALRGLAAAPRPDWRQLVMARRIEHTWQQSLTPPAYLGAPPAQAPQEAQEAPPAAADAPAELLVQGQGAVPGIVTGRVRLIDDLELVPEVQPGDVFVARDCGVLWAVLLPVAAAVVLDGSNPHEHAMRVCRDFGIPGVVQTRCATQILREGQRVTVDGTRGWVLAAS